MHETISLFGGENIAIQWNPPFLNAMRTRTTEPLGRSCKHLTSMETWDLLDEVLRYGLFLGAIFQIIAIAAIVVIPPKETQDVDDGEIVGGTVKDKIVVKQENKQQQNTSSVRKRTKDKKKR